MTAKFVFIGAIGAICGLGIAGFIGATIDPQHDPRLTVSWSAFLLAMVILGASGLIWFAEALQ